MNKLWAAILTAVVSIAASGGGTYYYLNNKAENDKASLQSQIDELNDQIGELNSQLISNGGEVGETIGEDDDESDKDELQDTAEKICSMLYPDAQYIETNSQEGEGAFCKVQEIIGDYARGTYGEVLDSSGGGVGCGWLAAKVNVEWKIVLETQDYYDCEKLETYSVPSELLDNDGTCYNNANQEYEDYDN